MARATHDKSNVYLMDERHYSFHSRTRGTSHKILDLGRSVTGRDITRSLRIRESQASGRVDLNALVKKGEGYSVVRGHYMVILGLDNNEI